MIKLINRCLLRCIVLTAMAVLWASPDLFSQHFNFINKRSYVINSFRLGNNLIIIPLMINGKGPFNFILDTGVGIVLITEPKLIDSLAPLPTREITINGIGEGKEMQALVHPSVKLEIGHSISGTMPVAILKNEPLDLSSFVGMPVYGLIGYELFDSFIIRLNYVSKTITYYKRETAFIPKKGVRVPISIEDRKPYLESEVTFSGGKKKVVKLIIDTGAGHPLSLETEDGIPYVIPEVNIKANLGVGLSGTINGFIGRIPHLALGKFDLPNVICAFPDYNDVAAKVPLINRNGNIGNNILKRFDVVFDYSREVMYLKPNYSFKDPFEHDMTGMELTTYGEDFKGIMVVRVEPGSSAEQIGIKANDRILSVNFKKVEETNMEEISGLFKSKDGRAIVLEILSANAKDSKFHILPLKRRI